MDKQKEILPKTLDEIAKELTKKESKKVQLIYAFNGTGKTRLSKAFKNLIDLKSENDESNENDETEDTSKVLYYNAFTEDLFYWDNDLENDIEPKPILKIQNNTFTSKILTSVKDQGMEGKIATNFQHYVNNKLNPKFNEDFSEVTFSFEGGNEGDGKNIKISKGEESNFVWSVFYTYLQEVISDLEEKTKEEKDESIYKNLEYVFIDDPVSSLDDNHLIQLAVDLAGLIKKNKTNLKFIITTHNPLFYNVLYNEINNKIGYILEICEKDTFFLTEKQGDSNTNFAYHLHLKQIIEKAIKDNDNIDNDNKIEKYHFTLLRNLYEKTASFLGYPHWSNLLPGDKKLYLQRITNFTSHSSLPNESYADPTEPEKQIVKFLLKHLKDTIPFYKEEEKKEEDPKTSKKAPND